MKFKNLKIYKDIHLPITLLDILVLAALMIESLPSSSTGILNCSWIYLTANLLFI